MRLGRRLSSGIAEDPPAPTREPAREEPARHEASTATRAQRREPAPAER